MAGSTMRTYFDDPELYNLIHQVCSRLGINPTWNQETEDFIQGIISKNPGEGNPQSVERWLDHQLRQCFIAANGRPTWLQNPEWPFENGQPMIFIGQIPVTNNSADSGFTVLNLFPHDGAFYLFLSSNGTTKVLYQEE